MTYETGTITGKLFEDKTFSFPIRVYYEDTDAGGIVYYANYLKFAERARTEYLRHIGFSQDELLKNQGVGFVVRECHIRYKTPAKLDDALNITCKVTEMKGASLKMEQKLCRGETILAEVEVSLVFLSIQTMRPTKIPQEITSIF